MPRPWTAITYVNITDADTTALGSVAEEYAARQVGRRGERDGCSSDRFRRCLQAGKANRGKAASMKPSSAAQESLAEALLEKTALTNGA